MNNNDLFNILYNKPMRTIYSLGAISGVISTIQQAKSLCQSPHTYTLVEKIGEISSNPDLTNIALMGGTFIVLSVVGSRGRENQLINKDYFNRNFVNNAINRGERLRENEMSNSFTSSFYSAAIGMVRTMAEVTKPLINIASRNPLMGRSIQEEIKAETRNHQISHLTGRIAAYSCIATTVIKYL
jgi:hypothetical protein